tara:strand:- start:8186 stop:8905 length:720 start_codon:yes stop_codon:yes gene_type:complete
MIYPKVSAIITTFNRFDYFLNALNSVLSQNYPNLEIIVINDESDDERYKTYSYDERVNMIHVEKSSTPDWGGSRQPLRNIAANAATGKYLAFLDDDDLWLPNKLDKQITRLENSSYEMSSTEGLYGEGVYEPNKEYPLYNTGRWYGYIKKKYRGSGYIKRKKFPEIWDYNFLEIHNCMILSSVVVNRELFIKLGGFRGLPRLSDYDCWLGMLQMTSSVYINEPLFYYDNDHGDGRNYSK